MVVVHVFVCCSTDWMTGSTTTLVVVAAAMMMMLMNNKTRTIISSCTRLKLPLMYVRRGHRVNLNQPQQCAVLRDVSCRDKKCCQEKLNFRLHICIYRHDDEENELDHLMGFYSWLYTNFESVHQHHYLCPSVCLSFWIYLSLCQYYWWRRQRQTIVCNSSRHWAATMVQIDLIN